MSATSFFLQQLLTQECNATSFVIVDDNCRSHEQPNKSPCCNPRFSQNPTRRSQRTKGRRVPRRQRSNAKMPNRWETSCPFSSTSAEAEAPVPQLPSSRPLQRTQTPPSPTASLSPRLPRRKSSVEDMIPKLPPRQTLENLFDQNDNDDKNRSSSPIRAVAA